jgi:hypothetical protein
MLSADRLRARAVAAEARAAAAEALAAEAAAAAAAAVPEIGVGNDGQAPPGEDDVAAAAGQEVDNMAVDNAPEVENNISQAVRTIIRLSSLLIFLLLIRYLWHVRQENQDVEPLKDIFITMDKFDL